MVDAGTVGGDGSPGLTVAMHMSDGLVNAPTAAVFGLVAAIGLAIAASRARADLDERTAPMAGLVTAFVFAVQMINFPILPGASGHLLGGALVAILVGPWVGSLCIAIVLVVQALLFADGGADRARARTSRTWPWSARSPATSSRTRCAGSPRAPAPACSSRRFVAALISTVVASLAFVLEYAIGGAGGAGLGTVFALMVGLHVLSASARGSSPRPRSAPSRPSAPTSCTCCAAPAPRSTLRARRRGAAMNAPRSRFLLGFLLAALVIAGGLSYFASPDPDGLDSVTLHGCTVSETAAASSSTAPASPSTPTGPRDGRQPARRLRRRRRRGHHRPRRDRRRAGDRAGRGTALPGPPPAAARRSGKG